MDATNERAEKLHIGGVEQDDERCLRCGSMSLDIGWECTDCGYDNMTPHYANPEHKPHPTWLAQAQKEIANGDV